MPGTVIVVPHLWTARGGHRMFLNAERSGERHQGRQRETLPQFLPPLEATTTDSVVVSSSPDPFSLGSDGCEIAATCAFLMTSGFAIPGEKSPMTGIAEILRSGSVGACRSNS